MNKRRSKREATHGRLLTMAIVALFLLLGNNSIVRAINESSRNLEEQQQQINGVVVDANSNPIIGASVVEKGSTSNGTITDLDGKFSLKVKPGATITVSYIGYKTQGLKVTAGSMKVVLQEDSELLGEVVVIGYGTQKKENLTGAVSSVDVEKTLDNRPIADVGRSLQGAVPGLSITVPSGEVGSDLVLRIRGQIASIEGTASSNPLILLDNVEIPSISLVNPDDIESISVLKDAAS
ncbi:TonB-dependent receptor SusC, partial [termite gut metagenome]